MEMRLYSWVLARSLARQLDMDEDAITKEMQSGDYMNLVKTMDKYFPLLFLKQRTMNTWRRFMLKELILSSMMSLTPLVECRYSADKTTIYHRRKRSVLHRMFI